MVETLGPNGKYILTILLVLALVGLVAWLLRQFSPARRALSGLARNRQPRLAVLDHVSVDARRKLVLIRRDNIEHLILIGGPTDVVVEMNIVRAMAVTPLARTLRPDESEAPLAAEPAVEIERPRPDPKMPRVERSDPQYLEMQKKLEAAMTKPAETEAPTPKVEPRPVAVAPAPVEPRVVAPAPIAPVQPEPKVIVAPAPEPIAAPRYERVEPRAPEPRPIAAAPQPIPQPMPRPAPQPAPEVAAKPAGPDPFVSLEEEMASLLRPGQRPQ